MVYRIYPTHKLFIGFLVILYVINSDLPLQYIKGISTGGTKPRHILNVIIYLDGYKKVINTDKNYIGFPRLARL